jgi:mannosyltransferase OCH1-like enzyme
MSIPKKIHYCWLSGEKMSDDALKCIDSWKQKMPEYELVLWDKNKFNITSVEFVKEAYNARKWACASDYIRLYAIYTEGGIYLDSDVYVIKSFNDFLENGFFTSVEYHKYWAKKENAYELLNEDGTLKNPKDRIFTRFIGIQAAVFGGIQGHPFLKSCLEWYKNKHFILPDGTYYYNKLSSPAVYADVAIEYGFRYKDELQKLKDNIVIYPSWIFSDGLVKDLKDIEESYSVHCGHGSWRNKTRETIFTIIRNKLSKNNFLRKILGRKPFLSIEKLRKYCSKKNGI